MAKASSTTPLNRELRRYGATTERLSPDGEWVVASEETSLMRERGEATDAFQLRVKRWAGLLIQAQLPALARDHVTCDVVFHWVDGEITRASIVILPRIDMSTIGHQPEE